MDKKKKMSLALYLGKSPKFKNSDTSMGSKGSLFNKFENPAMDRGTSELADPSMDRGTPKLDVDTSGESVKSMKKGRDKKYKELLDSLGK